jgi:hypothetical protein
MSRTVIVGQQQSAGSHNVKERCDYRCRCARGLHLLHVISASVKVNRAMRARWYRVSIAAVDYRRVISLLRQELSQLANQGLVIMWHANVLG